MPSSDFRPTVDEVGGRLGGRTLEAETGKRAGTFNAQTFPTADIVVQLIDDSVATVSAALGSEVEEEYWPMAKAAAIAYTCMQIEAGYYPETVGNPDSAYNSFKERFQEQIKFIETALNQRRPNERRIVSLRQETLVGIRGGRLDPYANELFP